MFRKPLAFVMALLVASVTVGATMAQEESDDLPKLGIQPVGIEGSYFDLELKPGQERELAVELGNFGSTEQRVRTYPADVYSRINGGFEAELDGAPTSGATEWLDYEAETFALAAGETVERTFTVTVPEDATPGEYITSLVIQNADPVRGTGGVAIEQVLRQVIAVAITVPGPRQPKLEIGTASYQQLPAFTSVRVALENAGNVRVQPTAQFALEDAAGEEVTSATVELESIYAGTETFVEVGLVQPLPPGDYVVSLALEDEERDVAVEAAALPLVVEAPATPVAVTTPGITAMEIAETRDDAGTLQFVEPVVTLQNPGAELRNAQVILTVNRDGQKVEEYPLGTSLTIAPGETQVRQRYIPAGGWEPGTYTFTVTMSTVDPNNGSTVELATVDVEQTVVAE